MLGILNLDAAPVRQLCMRGVYFFPSVGKFMLYVSKPALLNQHFAAYLHSSVHHIVLLWVRKQDFLMAI